METKVLLKKLREEHGLSQEQLAERAEVSPIYIRYIENAKRTARLDTYVRIANALGCTMDDLLKGFQTGDRQGRYLDELLADCDQREIERIAAVVAQLKQVLRS